MERFYQIKENYAVIELASKLYPIIAIQKAIANNMEQVYIKLEELDDKIIIKMKLQENQDNLDTIIGEFYNELLRESLRYNIAIETKNLRELIISRALYTTCIETENEVEETNINTEDQLKISEYEDYSLDEIAINWFQKFDNNND